MPGRWPLSIPKHLPNSMFINRLAKEGGREGGREAGRVGIGGGPVPLGLPGGLQKGAEKGEWGCGEAPCSHQPRLLSLGGF